MLKMYHPVIMASTPYAGGRLDSTVLAHLKLSKGQVFCQKSHNCSTTHCSRAFKGVGLEQKL